MITTALHKTRRISVTASKIVPHRGLELGQDRLAARSFRVFKADRTGRLTRWSCLTRRMRKPDSSPPGRRTPIEPAVKKFVSGLELGIPRSSTCVNAYLAHADLLVQRLMVMKRPHRRRLNIRMDDSLLTVGQSPESIIDSGYQLSEKLQLLPRSVIKTSFFSAEEERLGPDLLQKNP